MATCTNCGADSPRVRSRWIKSERMPDECPMCSPQSFEAVHDPSSQKIWIGPEFAPNDYIKREDSLGTRFDLKPEAARELELNQTVNSRRAIEEREAMAKKAADKRLTRRTKALDPLEIAQAIRFADEQIRPLIEDPDISYDA